VCLGFSVGGGFAIFHAQKHACSAVRNDDAKSGEKTELFIPNPPGGRSSAAAASGIQFGCVE